MLYVQSFHKFSNSTLDETQRGTASAFTKAFSCINFSWGRASNSPIPRTVHLYIILFPKYDSLANLTAKVVIFDLFTNFGYFSTTISGSISGTVGIGGSFSFAVLVSVFAEAVVVVTVVVCDGWSYKVTVHDGDVTVNVGDEAFVAAGCNRLVTSELLDGFIKVDKGLRVATRCGVEVGVSGV